jgi:hypothetical protein
MIYKFQNEVVKTSTSGIGVASKEPNLGRLPAVSL